MRLLLDGVVTDGDSEGMRETRSEDRGVCVVCVCGWIYSGVNFEKTFTIFFKRGTYSSPRSLPLSTQHSVGTRRRHTPHASLPKLSTLHTAHKEEETTRAHATYHKRARHTHLLHARTARNQRAPLKQKRYRLIAARTQSVLFVVVASKP